MPMAFEEHSTSREGPCCPHGQALAQAGETTGCGTANGRTGGTGTSRAVTLVSPWPRPLESSTKGAGLGAEHMADNGKHCGWKTRLHAASFGTFSLAPSHLTWSPPGLLSGSRLRSSHQGGPCPDLWTCMTSSLTGRPEAVKGSDSDNGVNVPGSVGCGR